MPSVLVNIWGSSDPAYTSPALPPHLPQYLPQYPYHLPQLGDHDRALRLLVHDLRDFRAAEEYCRSQLQQLKRRSVSTTTTTATTTAAGGAKQQQQPPLLYLLMLKAYLHPDDRRVDFAPVILNSELSGAID